MATTKEVTENIEKLEDLAERAEAVAEAAEFAVNRRLDITLGLIVVGVAVASGVTGYLIAKRHLEGKINARADHEIAEAKRFYGRSNKAGVYSTPEQALEALHPDLNAAADALATYQGQAEEEEVKEDTAPEVVIEASNVFVQASADDIEFDLEEEMKHRTKDKPYIISHEEFMTAEPEYEQDTLTYYAGDSTLADAQDEPIPVPTDIVGEDTLENFGYGSGDKRIVYVRNDKLARDFEICLSDGKFAHEVLGLQHSDEPYSRRGQLRKFRGGDE